MCKNDSRSCHGRAAWSIGPWTGSCWCAACLNRVKTRQDKQMSLSNIIIASQLNWPNQMSDTNTFELRLMSDIYEKCIQEQRDKNKTKPNNKWKVSLIIPSPFFFFLRRRQDTTRCMTMNEECHNCHIVATTPTTTHKKKEVIFFFAPVVIGKLHSDFCIS